MKKKVTFTVTVILILYVLSYVINSSAGGYWKRPESDGTDKLLGVELKTALLWQPRFGYHSDSRTDILGAIYIPMIWIDRLIFHRTLYLSNLSTWKNAGTTKYHPNSE